MNDLLPRATLSETIKMHCRIGMHSGVGTYNMVTELVNRTGEVSIAILYGNLLATPQRHTKQRAKVFKMLCDALDAVK